ncbi:MAG TPA: hypothetical protein VGG48_11895 [Rhizomicrobium sp.]|jgi:plasmid stability protein
MGILVDLNEDLDTRLRQRATAHGRSVEEEVQTILTESLGPAPQASNSENLYDQIRADVARFGGGIALELPPRQEVREPPDFSTAKYDRLNQDDHS